MRNPFKKERRSVDSLVAILLSEIDELAILIEEIRKDLEELTDFVEDNLD
jgi:NTP pyrophosphatase (non-canonical NTP hydrolase)